MATKKCYISLFLFWVYHSSRYTKVSDKMAYGKSVDPDQISLKEQSDQGLLFAIPLSILRKKCIKSKI